MSHELLEDKSWLEDQYNAKYLTIQQIGELSGTNYGAARKALLFHMIPIRDFGYSRRLKKQFPRELEDKQWLVQKYEVEKLSLKSIGELLDIPFCNVRTALIRQNIEVRTKSQGQRLRYKENGIDDHFVFDKEVIEGSLLGDGFLTITNPRGVDCYPAFHKRNIYWDHVDYVASQIFSKDRNARIANRGENSGFLNAKPIWHMGTLSHLELLPTYRSWYPESNDFKKVIPNDIEITSKLLLHWFLDDGYSYFVKRSKLKYPRIRIEFATQSFQENELRMICDKVREKFGLVMKPRFHQKHGIVSGTGWSVKLAETLEQARLFFQVIGQPPVPSLAYKWKEVVTA